MRYEYITYGNENEVVFPYTRLDVDQQPIFASDGIQIEAVRYSFTIRGIITAGTVQDFDNLVCKMRKYLKMRGLLFQVSWIDDVTGPVLLYDFKGTSQVDSPPMTGIGDASWGPIPGPLHLSRFAGGISAAYEWTVQVTAKECFTNGCDAVNPSNKVLSLTTRFDHHIDVNGLTTRTVSGKLTLSTQSILKDQKSADGFRWLVYPEIPDSFKIIDQQYQQSENGREIAYMVVLREVPYTLPSPITNGDANFVIRLANTGLLAYFSLSGFFEAPYTVGKDVIIAQVGALVGSKLGPYLSGPNPVIFETQEIACTGMYEKNRIDFQFSGTFAANGNTTIGPDLYSSLKTTLAQPPPNSGGQAPVAYPYGGDASGGSGVVADLPLYHHDACAPVLSTSPSLIDLATVDHGSTRGSGSSSLPETGGRASTDHLAAPYIAYHEEIHFSLDNGVEVFYPKTAGQAPVWQQSRQPSMTIIQAGYQVRYANSVELVTKGVPDPIGSPDNRVILTADIIPSAPTPVGDGAFSQWTTHWRYVMRVIVPYTTNDTPAGSALGIDYPQDPRRPPQGVMPVQRTKNAILVPTT